MQIRGERMHIPENYLSPETNLVLAAAMVPIWLYSLKKVKEEMPREKLSLLGVGAALSFLGMMFNIPLPGGTTGHAVGAVLIAILAGPYAAVLAISVALFLQALFFGDGGILAFGANCFNMAFLMPFVGFFIYKLSKETLWGAALAGYVAINVAAFCAAVEFGIQPLLFTDDAGNALYFPYPLAVAVPAMMLGHLTLFGLCEAVYTVLLLKCFKVIDPNIQANTTFALPYKLLAALIILTPLGLLAEGTAWGEWSIEEIAQDIGYMPAGFLNGFDYNVPLPDYTILSMSEPTAYILSAIIGTSLSILIFRLCSRT